MKIKISSILKTVLLSIFGLLLFISLCLPAIKVTYQNQSSKIYLFDILGGLGISSLSSSSSSVSLNSFYGILSILVLVIGVILCTFGEKKLTKAIGAGMYFTFFAFNIVIFTQVKDLIDSAKSNSSSTYSMVGTTMLLVSSIFALLLVLVSLFSNSIDKGISEAKKMKGMQTKEEKLVEIKNLLDKGLITQEEYESKKKDILDEK